MMMLRAHEPEAVSRPGDRSPPGAVDKAMTVLSELIVNNRPMRLAELTRRTGLPKSTVHRLVGILRAYDMVDQRDEAYVPGARLAQVRVPTSDAYLKLVGRLAKPYLVDLYDATGASTSLGVLGGKEVRYVERVYGHRSIRTPSYESERAPAHCTATGKILLASSTDTLTVRQEGQALAAMTRSTITVPTALWAELREIRRTGIAYSREEYVSGVVCAAVLVMRGTARLPPAAIAISGKASGLDLAAVSPQLLRAAFALATSIRQAMSQAGRAGQNTASRPPTGHPDRTRPGDAGADGSAGDATGTQRRPWDGSPAPGCDGRRGER